MSRPPLRYPLTVAQTCLLIVLMAVLRGPAYGPPPSVVPTPPARVAARAAAILDIEDVAPAAARADMAARTTAARAARATASPLPSPVGWALGVAGLAAGLGLWRRARAEAVEQ